MHEEVSSSMLQSRNVVLPNVSYLKQYLLSLPTNEILLQLFIDEIYEYLKITTLQNIS